MAETATKARYTAPSPGFGFSDVPQTEFDYPFPALTLEQRMRFELFGYTIVEDLFTEPELQSIEASANRLKAEILEAAGNVEITPPPPPRKYEDFRDGAIWRANRRRTASGDLHPASSRVAMSTDGGASWSTLAELDELNAAELLPVAGTTGAVYVLTTASRRPLAVGGEPPLNVLQSTERSASGLSGTQLLAWILAGNASAALGILAFGEFKGGARRLQPGPREARRRTAAPPVELGTLQAG